MRDLLSENEELRRANVGLAHQLAACREETGHLSTLLDQSSSRSQFQSNQRINKEVSLRWALDDTVHSLGETDKKLQGATMELERMKIIQRETVNELLNFKKMHYESMERAKEREEELQERLRRFQQELELLRRNAENRQKEEKLEKEERPKLESEKKKMVFGKLKSDSEKTRFEIENRELKIQIQKILKEKKEVKHVYEEKKEDLELIKVLRKVEKERDDLLKEISILKKSNEHKKGSNYFESLP